MVGLKPTIAYLLERENELPPSSSELTTTTLTTTLTNFVTTLKSAKGIERNLLAKKCLQKISYSPETIGITFFFHDDTDDTSSFKTQTPLLAGLLAQTPVKEFEPMGLAPYRTTLRTFTLTFPNLIHKSKRLLP